MALKAYQVKGRFQMGRGWTPFTLETTDETEDGARERIISSLGSRHRVKRRRIEIDSVAEIGKGEVTDPVVEQRLENGA